MKFRLCGALIAAAAGLLVAKPAPAQNRLTVAIMPTQYFSADPESAKQMTEALAQQFERQGYEVIALDATRQKFEGMGLSLQQHYPDRVAAKLGAQMQADLVCYPRLLALGIPAANGTITEGSLFEPAAVLHLRVLNVHTRQPIYFRQIAHEFRTDVQTTAREFQLPQPVAVATAGEVSGMYFERVAGSRQEFRR